MSTLADPFAAPRPLTPARDAGKGWRWPADYRFARRWRRVPLSPGEVAKIACALPVGFTAEGRPVAVLRGAAQEASPFITAEGRWQAMVTPQALRFYPLAPAPGGGPGLCGGDEYLGEAGGAGVTGFFDEDGSVSEPLGEIMAALSAGQGRADEAGRALAEAGVLEPMGFADLPEARLFAVHPARFSALDGAGFLRLRRAGALELIYAHFISCGHIAWMEKAYAWQMRQADRPEPPTRKHSAGKSARAALPDFLASFQRAGDEGREERLIFENIDNLIIKPGSKDDGEAERITPGRLAGPLLPSGACGLRGPAGERRG